MKTYWETLQEAIQHTASLGMGENSLAKVPAPVLTEDVGFAFMEAFGESISYDGLTLVDLPFRCAEISWRAKPILEKLTQTKVVLTLGAVARNDHFLWPVNSLNIKELRTTGSYHVWLSLASGEIVDLTLSPSLLLQRGHDLTKAQPLAGLPHQMAFQWVPKLVGDEPIRRILTHQPC